MNSFDLARRLNIARSAIRQHLEECGVPQTIDGFFAVRLSGDEDAETQKLYTEKYGPLVSLENELVRLGRQLDAEDADPSKDSVVLDRLNLAGDEDDATILRVVRAASDPINSILGS